MALAAYSRFKLFWGAVDAEHSDEAAYSPAQTKPMGDSAAPPGIGVRRCSIRFTRLGITPVEDILTTYLDFQNFTSGEPDDTWVDADFTLLETALDTFWGNIKAQAWTKHVLAEYRWYRIGPGVFPPNPAIRIQGRNVPGLATQPLPPQMAISLTKKTAARRQWGRMYLPLNDINNMDSNGRVVPAKADSIVTAANALMGTASAADFLPVVYSPTRGKAYSIEHFQVDDIWDVIRSRRYDKPVYKKILP